MTAAWAWAAACLALLAGVVVVALAMLAGWRDWLALQRQLGRPHADDPRPAAGRIELADLRERVRKLEAIAAGVEW